MQGLEAERRLCAVAILRNDWLDDVADLSPAHFENYQYGVLYDLIVDAHRRGLAVTMPVLQPQIDPSAYDALDRLVRETAPGAKKAFVSLARTIRQECARRDLLRVAQDMLAMVQGSVDDPASIASGMEDAMRRVDTGSGRKLMTMRDAAIGVAAGLAEKAVGGIKTGYADLDKRFGCFGPGDLIILAGRPGSGKSSFAMNLARNWGLAGLKGHVASYEMSAQQIGSRTIGALGGLEYSRLRKAPEEFNPIDIEAIARTAPDGVLLDCAPAQTVAQLEMSARETRRRLNGLDFVVVDYLQLMRASSKAPRHEQVAEISRDLKTMAQRLSLPVVALAQLNRASEGRTDNRPQLADIRESGAVEQDADMVLGLYREAYYLEQKKPDERNFDEFKEWARKFQACKHVLEVITLKNRQGSVGVDKLTAILAHDKISSFTGPQAVPASRMRRDYE